MLCAYEKQRIFFRPFGWAIALLCVLFAHHAHSQSNQVHQFGETQQFDVDSIDLASLTVKIDLPLMQKAGRGQNLLLKMSYAADSTVTDPLLGWTPIMQGLLGKVSYTLAGCGNQGCGYINWVYTDTYGTQHHFGGAYYSNLHGCANGTALGL